MSLRNMCPMCLYHTLKVFLVLMSWSCGQLKRCSTNISFMKPVFRAWLYMKRESRPLLPCASDPNTLLYWSSLFPTNPHTCTQTSCGFVHWLVHTLPCGKKGMLNKDLCYSRTKATVCITNHLLFLSLWLNHV